MKAIYGVDGLIDWNAVFMVGKAAVHVRFSGGATTKYGSFPAQYETSDLMMRHIIENSEYFRSGKVRLIFGEKLELVMGSLKREPRNKAQNEATERAMEQHGANSIAATEAEQGPQAGCIAATEAEQGPQEGRIQPLEAVGEEQEGVTKIEVACLEDAIDHLNDRFHASIGYSDLPSWEKLDAYCQSFNLKFVRKK